MTEDEKRELRKWAVEQAGGDLDHAQKMYEFAANEKSVQQQITVNMAVDAGSAEQLMKELRKPGVVESAADPQAWRAFVRGHDGRDRSVKAWHCGLAPMLTYTDASHSRLLSAPMLDVLEALDGTDRARAAAAQPARREVVEERQYEIYSGKALGCPYTVKLGVIRVPREDGQGHEYEAAFQYNVADGVTRWLLLDEVVGTLMRAGQPGTSGKMPNEPR